MNAKIKNIREEILSRNWATLKKLTYDFIKKNGETETHVRESYDRGNGATILLFNPQTKKIILTKQFRIPTYLNGNADGMMIEACAGKLDEDNPDDCIRREVEEETGYVIQDVKRIFESYMSPGSVTEIIYFYIGRYDESMKESSGGGKESEQEEIEVLEIDFNQALTMMKEQKIRDAKTIMLLQYAEIHNIMKLP